MKFRKKPVVIDAVHWDESDNAWELLKELGIEQCGMSVDCAESGLKWSNLMIITLERILSVSPGDYVIKGIQGEFYTCKPDIFEKTYEKV